MKVLLLGNNDRSALACCRSLGENGITVGIAPMGEWGIAHRSRHCKMLHEIGSLSEDVQLTGERLCRLVDMEEYEVVIPLSDATCLICYEFQEELQGKVALPSEATFSFAHNKKKLLERCRELSIPVPEEASLESSSLYLKPIHSAIFHNNRALQFEVKRAGSRREASDFLREHAGVVEVLQQEEVPGEGVGVYLLAQDGKILSMVQQNRLHEPMGGGAGSYRVTVPLDPDLRDYTERLIASIGWTGVAMVEFKGGAGRWRIMELNGRFWGSLALTTQAGGNFPLWVAQQTAGKTVHATQPHYGVRQRHLAKDLLWAVKNGNLLRWTKELLVHRDPLDIEKVDDPMPALSYWTRYSEKVGSWWHRRAEWNDYRLTEKNLRNSILSDFEPDTHVLFVCHGNICRSPFAERYCTEKLGWEKVRSCGTFPVPNRRVSEVAESVSRDEFGVDLSSHQSKVIDESLIRWADVIIVMDQNQLAELAPLVRGQMLLLRPGKEIRDPYGGDERDYRDCYQTIARACKEMHSYAKVSLPSR